MKIAVFFFYAASFLLLASPAHAEPITIALFGSAFAATTAGTIVSALFSVAVGFASTLIQKMLAGEPKQKAVGVKLEVEMGDDIPVSTTLGYAATTGKRKYIGTYGKVKDTPNAFMVDVVEIGNLPFFGATIADLALWVDDKKTAIITTAGSNTDKGYPLEEYRVIEDDGNIVDFAWIKFHNGTQTTADAYLVEKFGEDDDRPWTAAMVGRGCPYVVLTYRFKQKFFSRVPMCVFETPIMKLYNIAKDSTNGGNGSHRWNDKSTWESSTNNAIIIYNIIRGMYFRDKWFFGGQNLLASRLPSSSWIAAIQECDRLITIPNTASEKQFRAGIEVTGDDQPIDVIEELRAGCAGRLAEVGGSFKLQVGAFGAAVYSFFDEDIVITEGQTFDPFPGLQSTYNSIEATFPDPKQKWASKDAPIITDDNLEIADGGRRLPVSLKFTAVPFARQVQRLMRAMLKEERRFRTHEFQLPPDAWRLEPNDIVSWTSQRNGYVNKKFIVLQIEGQMTMNQLVRIKELDPTDYDWSPSFEQPTRDGPVGPKAVPVQIMADVTAVPIVIYDDDGVGRRPGIQVACRPNVEDIDRVWITMHQKSTGVLVHDSSQYQYDTPEPYSWNISGMWMLPLTTYEVRLKIIPQTNRETAFTAPIEVTTLDTQFGTKDILNNSITQSKIADAAISANKIASEAVTGVKLAAQAVTTAKLAIEAVTPEILATGAVIASKLAAASVERDKLAAEAVDATKLASSISAVVNVTAVPTTNVGPAVSVNGVLYRWTGTVYTKAVDAPEISGQLVSAQIADFAITNAKLLALAVDASKLAANAVTNTKIADDAISTPKLQANAVVADKIAAGAIIAEKLAVGTGANSFDNSDFSAGLSGWRIDQGNGVAGSSIDQGNEWTLNEQASVHVATGANEVYANVIPINKDDQTQKKFPVIPGKRYEVSAYTAAHRCDVFVMMTFFGVDGNVISEHTGTVNSETAVGGKSLSNYYRSFLIMNAPAGAVYVLPYVRKNRTWPGQGDSHMWATSLLFAEATPNQTEPSRWSTGGMTIIGSGNIVTNAITSDKILAGAIVAGKLSAGAVTAGTIAANAITAGTIAAGAVNADQIAANAITSAKILAGAISADKLAVGKGSNWITNSNADAEINNWWFSATGGEWYLSKRDDTYSPAGGCFEMAQVGAVNNDQYADLSPRTPGSLAVNESYPVQELTWVEASVYVYGHRSNYTRLHIAYLNAAGAVLGYSFADAPTHQNGNPVRQLANYQRIWVKGQAPSGTTQVQIFARVWGHSAAYGYDSYTWLSQFYLGQATQFQTEPSPWSEGGVTLINAGNIVTNAVTADKIQANAIVAGKIAAGAVTADKIQANAVTAVAIAASTISGDKLQANTLGAREIAAQSITAKHLVLTDFNNLVPDNQMTSTDAWVGTIPGWIVWGDHGLFQSYNGMVFNAGPWGSGGYTNCQSRAFAVKGSTPYRLTGQMYSNNNYDAFIRALWIDASGNIITYTDFAVSGARGSGATGLLTQNVMSPGNTATVIIELFVNRTNTAGAVYFGGVGMFERNAADLIVDGGITADKIAANVITAAMLQAGSVSTDKLTVNGVTYDKLGQWASGQLAIVEDASAFTVGNAFSSRVSAGITKPTADGMEVVSSFRVRCTNLGGALSASVQYRLREYLNGNYTADVEYGKVYFTDTTNDATDVVSAYLIHMKPAGPSGNYSYSLEIKKNTPASDFIIGVGRIGIKLGTKTG